MHITHWQQASKLQPCGALNRFGKIEIHGLINIVIIIIISFAWLFYFLLFLKLFSLFLGFFGGSIMCILDRYCQTYRKAEQKKVSNLMTKKKKKKN